MPLIVAANAAVGKSWARAATFVLGGLVVWGVVAVGVLGLAEMLMSSRLDQAQFAVSAGSVVSGVAAAGFLFPAIRTDVAGWLKIDPSNPVHTLALMLAVIVLGIQLSTLLFTDVLKALGAQSPQTLFDVFLDELPLLVIAVAGVGVVVRRSTSATLARLGVVVPAWWQPVLALAIAGLFLAVLQGVDIANHYVMPGTAQRVDAVNNHLFSEIARSGWVGVALMALVPGICEEVLFRGAVQPRLGIVVTALLFTSIHSQYGVSLDLAGVFLIALGLGVIRKWTNTTTAICTHVGYNFLAGVTLTGTSLYVAIAAEAVLIVVAAIAIWPRLRALKGWSAPPSEG